MQSCTCIRINKYTYVQNSNTENQPKKKGKPNDNYKLFVHI